MLLMKGSQSTFSQHRKCSLPNWWCWNIWVSFYEKNFNSCLALYVKINLNLIINLDIKARTMKLLEDNIENLWDLGLGKDFRAQEKKSDNLNLIFKTCILQRILKRKWKAISWKKIFASCMFDKGCVSRILRILKT